MPCPALSDYELYISVYVTTDLLLRYVATNLLQRHLPHKRTIINLSPADIKKEGADYRIDNICWAL